MSEQFPNLPRRYRIERLLGRGTQKSVYLARDESLDRPVAIAVLDDSTVATAPGEGLYEARALARIADHPDVISVFDVIESPGRLYVISQYAPGGDLQHALTASGSEGLPLERSLRIGLQVARALDYAHQRGVVHQDVKPGNVFLDERGNGLLGDFGLADIRGRPREAADGLIAGTPGYMAPEVLYGAAPAPASDLYSLGCMLYELVTGQLPFASHADQLAGHPVVAPRAHVPSLPVMLSDLIVGLLEHDPQSRPASARDVAAALEGILTAGVVMPGVSDPGRERLRTSPRRMPRTVGRQAEIEAIRAALAAARDGISGLLLIEADAGMGKTQLIDELRAQSVHDGMAALVGRGREDAAFPFMAMVEALMPTASDCHALPAAEAETLRVFLSLRTPERPDTEPRTESDQHRLFASMWRAVCALAARRPLALVLDDLQWVDSASRDLFVYFVAARRADAGSISERLLLAAGYRTGAAEPAFAEVLTRLRADPAAQIVRLTGVDAPAAAEIMTDAGIARPSDQLIALVHDASGGNPLFLRELVGHLQREDALTQRRGFTVAKPGAYDVPLPRSINTAIESHISSASEACQQILTSAAFLRPVFTLRFLATLEERSGDDVLVLLEEASERNLLIDEGHAFRFAHPLIRNAFQQRLGATRRQRMQLRLARCFASEFPESVSEIAHHLLMAGPAADREEAIAFTRRAADEAETKFAWTEATRFLEALVALDDGSSPSELAEVHRRAGAAFYYRSDVGPCMHHFERAIQLFRDTDDASGIARTVAMKYRALSIHGGVGIGEMMNVTELEGCLKLLGENHPALRAQVLGALAEVYWTGRMRNAADRCARDALELACAAGDHRVCAEMHSHVSMTQGQRLALLDAIHSLEAGMEAARQGDDPFQFDRCAQRVAPLLLMAGRLDDVAGAVERSRDLHSSDALIGPMSLTLLSAIRGDRAATEAAAARAIRRMAYSKLVWAATGVLTALAYARALHGDSASADQAIAMLLEPGRVFEHPRARSFEIYRPLVRVYAGLPTERGAIEWVRPISRSADPDYFTVLQACAQVEIAHALGVDTLPESTAAVLDAAARTDLLFTPGWPFFVPRMQALAALVGGSVEEGTARLRSAAKVATRLGADAELYRCLTDLGALLTRSPERTRRREAEHVLQDALRVSAGRFSVALSSAAAAPAH